MAVQHPPMVLMLFLSCVYLVTCCDCDVTKCDQCHTFLFLFLFLFGLTTHKKCRKVSHSHSHMMECHMIKSHEECEKIVHRPCSSCISSVQEINKDFIKFSLSTWTWSGFKLSQPKSYTGLPITTRTIVVLINLWLSLLFFSIFHRFLFVFL